MYKQNGLDVITSKITGGFLLCFLFPMPVIIVINIISAIRQDTTWEESIAFIIVATIFMLGLLFLASFYLWMYPAITLARDGLKLSSFFLSLIIEWEHVDSVVRMGDRQTIILINKKGMFIQRHHGLFRARQWDKPVVIYSASQKNQDLFENEISKHLHNRDR